MDVRPALASDLTRWLDEPAIPFHSILAGRCPFTSWQAFTNITDNDLKALKFPMGARRKLLKAATEAAADAATAAAGTADATAAVDAKTNVASGAGGDAKAGGEREEVEISDADLAHDFAVACALGHATGGAASLWFRKLRRETPFVFVCI